MGLTVIPILAIPRFLRQRNKRIRRGSATFGNKFQKISSEILRMKKDGQRHGQRQQSKTTRPTMRYETIHFRILRLLDWLCVDLSRGLSCDDIAYYVGMDVSDVSGIMSQMIAPDFSEIGPWCVLIHGRYRISGRRGTADSAVVESTGGYSALDGAIERATIECNDADGWKNEALTGMDARGKRSKIDHAVLPRHAGANFSGDAEHRAEKSNRKFIDSTGEISIKKYKLRYCPQCHKVLISGKTSACRNCEKRRKRLSRAVRRGHAT